MEYTLELKNGKIPMYFGNGTMENFCEAHGNLSFTQLQDLFSGGVSFKHVIDLLFYGAEFYSRLHKKPFDYTRVDASVWLDEIGGMMSDEMEKIYLLVGKVINPKYQGVEAERSNTEKKSETSVGLNYESTVLEPA